MAFSRDKRQETIIYLVLWSLLFIAPVLSLYIHTQSTQEQFLWSEVFTVWRQMAVFFAFFLIHNYLLAPLIVYQQKKALYVSSIVVITAVFALYQCNNRPDIHADGMAEHHPPTEKNDGRPGPPPDFNGQLPPDFNGQLPPEPPDNKAKPSDERPPLMVGQHDIIATIILILMLLANLGIKLSFKQRHDQRNIAELQRKSLEQQLEFLKYQLNPHFLMNTLNNIHALVDIDPERSKEAIIELSKILRYVLYESNHERVPMTKEIEFMANYTKLMRMRYGKKLKFTVDQPDDVQGANIPPLLFISFVENAFKHGVSYSHESFIAITGKRYNDKHGKLHLLWTCRNSKHPKPAIQHLTPDSHGGVGMANVRQRLDLIYGDRYSLGINEGDDTYEVILDIPLET